jgi:type VI secretion system secreted protein VgrG
MQNLSITIQTGDPLDVRDFTVEEHINHLFVVSVVALSTNQNIDLEAAIGMPATFTLREGEGRTWSGICSEIRQVSIEEGGAARYRVVIAPRLWLLTHRKNHRIFQFQTELAIALQILKEWDIVPQLRIGETYKPRKFKVQYDETDFDFVNRMFEEAGISYFFADGGTMVVTDAPQAGPVRERPLQFNAEPMSGDTNYATSVQAVRRVAPGKATLQDHDYRKPATYKMAQSAAAGVPAEQAIEAFDFQEGQFLFASPESGEKASDDRGTTRSDEAAGAALAKKRLAAKRFGAKEVTFEARAIDLTVGSVVGISGHARADFESERLLVLGLTTSGHADGGWSTSCEATLASEPFHPPMRTPRPAALGVESATVVGPPGEEIHCDEFGRVRVHFHWDRESQMDDKSSCWMHVNQPWGGAGFGGSMLPRVGQEVLVQFLGGDPDRPVVTGRVYTNLQPTPYTLPDNKTQSGFRTNSTGGGGGFNELMMEDKLGQELLRMRAEKDMLSRINNDKTTSIGRHRRSTIDGNDKEAVQGNQGNSVFGQMKSFVGADKIGDVVGSIVSWAGGQRVLDTVNKFMSKAASHEVTSDTGTTLVVGQSVIHMTPDAIIIQTPKLLLNPGVEVLQEAMLTGQTPSPTEA